MASLATRNTFAALQKSSKSKKDDGGKKKRSKDEKKSVSTADLEKAIFSQPSLGISNWADDDDEDGDYAMPALPAEWGEVRTRTQPKAEPTRAMHGRAPAATPAPPSARSFPYLQCCGRCDL
jgi:hypothetical protein